MKRACRDIRSCSVTLLLCVSDHSHGTGPVVLLPHFFVLLDTSYETSSINTIAKVTFSTCSCFAGDILTYEVRITNHIIADQNNTEI